MPKRASTKTVIVVSGPPGAGSTSVAKEVAKKLKLRYFSVGKIQKGFGKSKKEGKSSLEVWRKKYGTTKEFHENVLDAPQIEEAKKGNVVINSKLGIHFLKDLSDKKIWLDVPLKVRAQRTAERDKISCFRALKEIREREKIERREWRSIYGFDYFDLKKSADFVLDSSNLKLEQTVRRIVEFVKSRKSS